MVIDTSRSMEYTVAGKMRMDDAKQRALEMLDDLAESSRVAIVDTGDPSREWMSVAQARERLRGLTLRHRQPADDLSRGGRLWTVRRTRSRPNRARK